MYCTAVFELLMRDAVGNSFDGLQDPRAIYQPKYIPRPCIPHLYRTFRYFRGGVRCRKHDVTCDDGSAIGELRAE